jgi:hypothetical protein
MIIFVFFFYFLAYWQPFRNFKNEVHNFVSYYYYYYYYYITPTVVGWCIVILRFFFTIILILPHIFVRSISRRCLDQTLWNLVGISYAVDIPTKFHEVRWKESKIILNPPFFVSMATVVKFAQPIPILLAYFVPLDVDAVPIKLHQFLFGE